MNKTIAGFAKAFSIVVKLPEDDNRVMAAAERLASYFHREVVLINCLKEEEKNAVPNPGTGT